MSLDGMSRAESIKRKKSKRGGRGGGTGGEEEGDGNGDGDGHDDDPDSLHGGGGGSGSGHGGGGAKGRASKAALRSAPDMLVEHAELHLASFQPLLDEVDKLKANVWEANTLATEKLESAIEETETLAKALHHKVAPE